MNGGRRKKAAEAGAAFEDAIALAEQGKHAEAEAAFAKVAAEGTAELSRRWRASARPPKLAQRDPKAAVANATTQLAADGSARTRCCRISRRCAPALLLVDTAPYAEMRKRLEPLTAADRDIPPHRARTAGAVGLAGEGRRRRAPLVDMILADAETPSGARARRSRCCWRCSAAEGKS